MRSNLFLALAAKNQQTTRKHAKLPSMQRFKGSVFTFFISPADKAPGRSCLFANTSKVAPDSL